MNRSLMPQKNQTQQGGSDQLVKTTSLLYLKEALTDEAYEECAGLIQAAKEAGADSGEIRQVIAEHIRTVKERYGKTKVRFIRTKGD